MKKLFIIAALLLTACSFAPLETGSGFRFALEPVAVEGHTPQPESITVMMPTTSPELDTRRIALRINHRWDYYSAARWSDFLASLVQDNFTKTLDEAHLFKSVAPVDSGLVADKILKIEIRSFEAEYTDGNAAPLIKIRMSVSIVSRLERRPLASFTLKAEQRAAANSLTAIQAAFAAAFNDTQQQLVEKLEKKN
jgi:ABC-type uncharacterized transport system auxiliary subunit